MTTDQLIVSVSGVRGIVGRGLTPDVAGRFAAALGTYLDGGPVVVSGEPEKSALIEAVRYKAQTKMPPPDKGKQLPDEAVEALTAWVKMGAPWPDERSPYFRGGVPIPHKNV